MPKIKAIFCLHGFGSSAAIFRAACGRGWDVPSRFFLDGPEVDAYSGRRRWFPFTTLPVRLASGIANGAHAAEAAIQERLKEMGLTTDTPIALMGHSQGAMVCLKLLIGSKLNVRTITSLAGYLPSISTVDMHRSEHVALDLYASQADRYVSVAQVESTARTFERMYGVNVRLFVADNLSHKFVAAWLDRSLFTEIPYGEKEASC